MRTSTLVERILAEKPETRDSDRLLILYVWQAQGLKLTAEQIQQYKEVSSPESIRRTRQKLQEDGKYRASEQVEQERYERYVETKDAIATAPEAISWLSD